MSPTLLSDLHGPKTEFRKFGAFLQSRAVGTVDPWVDLVALADLQGLPGPSAVPSDTAVAATITTGSGSLSQTAGDNRWGTGISVARFGAKGDTKTNATGAMTAASAVLTVSAAAFAATDVGKAVTVPGAGASGAALVTTIAAFTSGTSVTLAVTATTTVSAKTIIWGTDDTTAIAATYAAAAPFGATVHFPNGDYTNTATINPTATTTRGYGATLRARGAAAFAMFQASDGFTMLGLTIELNKANTPDPASTTVGSGIYVFNATSFSGVNLRDLAIRNGWASGVYLGTNSAATDPANLPSTPATMDNVRVTNVGRGIFMYAVGDVKISNCQVTNTINEGIYDTLTLRTSVIGNTIVSSGGHGIVTQYSTGCRITGNTVRLAGMIGICVGGGSLTLKESVDFTITGNTVSGSSASGYSVDTTKIGALTTPVACYGTITGNVAIGNNPHGFYLHNPKFLTFTGNLARGNASAGIIIDGNACTISGNVSTANNIGMYFAGTVVGYGSHDLGRNTVTGNTAIQYGFDSQGAANTTFEFSGTGAPTLAAPQGSVYRRTDGGAGTSSYIKESGGITATGWVAK